MHKLLKDDGCIVLKHFCLPDGSKKVSENSLQTHLQLRVDIFPCPDGSIAFISCVY